jgi:hypothetical protein
VVLGKDYSVACIKIDAVTKIAEWTDHPMRSSDVDGLSKKFQDALKK